MVQKTEKEIVELRFRGVIKRAWHGAKKDEKKFAPTLEARIDRVGKAIKVFVEKNEVSATQAKKMTVKMGFCLADGRFYGKKKLEKLLRTDMSKRVSKRRAKTTDAKMCLVMCVPKMKKAKPK